MSKYIGNRIVPRHDGIWDKAKEYEPLTIVYEEELKGINGKHMVERASVEFMSFVEDVYILLRKD